MFANYVRTAWRHLIRRKGFTLLNVFGLSLGVASLLLIGLYLHHELSYESAHDKEDRVFRVVVDRLFEDGRTRSLAPTSPPLAEAIRSEVSEAEETARVFVPRYTTGRVTLHRGETSFYEESFFYADPSVFDIFSIPLLEGDAETALRNPRSVVVSESMAQKYFRSDNAVGQFLVLDDSVTVEVTGIMADLPTNTHIRPDFIAPYALLEYQYGDRAAGWWGWDLVYTYVLLRDGASRAAAASGIQQVLDDQASPRTSRRGYTYAAALQPLADIHLHSDREWEIAAGGDPTYLKAMAAIALLVLMLACINFVNLSTAQAARRAREIGVRKVLGSGQGRLVLQFLAESSLLSVGAVLLGTAGAAAALPFANSLAGTELSLELALIPWLVVLAVVLGLVAGCYPAFYLASLRPTSSLQGGVSPGGRGRSLLVVAQFTISIVMTAGTLIVYQQIGYLQSQRLGFNEDQVVVVTTGNLSRDLDAVKQEILSFPEVEHVSASSGVPGRKTELMQVIPEGRDDSTPVQMLWVDEDFAETLGLEIVAGRDFDRRFGTDAANGYLINEAAAEAFGWTASAVGKEISWTSGWGTKRGDVLGVVANFHVASLREHVEPLVLTIQPAYGYLAVRTVSNDLPGLIGGLNAWWRETEPGRPFEFAFLDEVFGRLYEREQTQASIFGAFAVLAVLIACMGLFGLAAYTAESRTREIGIRKVMGATVLQIYSMLSFSYARYVFIALLAGIPITYLAMEAWLDGFAHRVGIGPGIFLITGAAMLAVALGTVGYQSVRAALADPVESLRSE